MALVRATRCASCGAPVLWLRSYGFGEPRPIDPVAAPDGEVVIEVEDSRYRFVQPGEPVVGHRYRLHWPCPRPDGSPSATPAAAARERLDVSIVAHTHWDREWYLPFEAFRARLVDMVDEVLDVLECDPAFTAFHLDGHTALVDDYLAVRPEAEPRVRALVAGGRLVIGPWETLADEFLVSGETLVRDLQRGMQRARELGGVLPVGYLPDQFGHTAQLPQLLRLAGIGDVLVYRGVPETIGATRFFWEAPDGTSVRAELLPAGYCNAIRFEDDPKLLVDRVRDTETWLGDRLRGDLLLMNGCDHRPIQASVPGIVARVNALGAGRHRFTVRRLDDHLARQPVDGLPTWPGELRSTGGATVTPGVVSNRLDIRLATAAAERAVERWAEPLSALYLPAEAWPAGLLATAWTHLLRNAAHDSMAACSVDAVDRAVLLRAADARLIGEHVAQCAMAELAATVDAPPGALLVVNPAARRRTSVVEAEVPASGPCHVVAPDGTALPTQVVATRQDVEVDTTASGAALDAILDLIGQDRAAGYRIAGWVLDDGERPCCTLTIARDDDPTVDVDPLRDRLAALRAARPDTPVRVTIGLPAVSTLLAGPVGIEGLGWSAFGTAAGAGPATAVGAGDGWIANEQLRVEADDDGTLRVVTVDDIVLDGVARLVDGGDAGDTYNFSPPDIDTVVEMPEAVQVDVVEQGPVRARMDVVRTYRWPVGLEVERDGATGAQTTRRTAATEVVTVRTVVEVLTGEPFVRLRVELDNPCADHRLRLHVPLPAPVAGSDAESAFAVVHRGLTADANPMEAAQATFPSHRFVDCSDGMVGAGLVHDGAGEYEVVDDGHTLAFTVFRSVSQLSRGGAANRPANAGPEIPVPDARLLGPLTRTMALVPHGGRWDEAALPDVADDVLLPLQGVMVGPSTRSRGAVGSRLAVGGAQLSSLVRRDGELELRAVRLSSEPGELVVELDGQPATGSVVDLHGTALGPFDGTRALRPWEIVTLRLREPLPATR